MSRFAVLFSMMTICFSAVAVENQANIQIEATGNAKMGLTLTRLTELVIKNSVEVVKITCGPVAKGRQKVWISKESRETLGIKTSDSPEVYLEFNTLADCDHKIHAIRAKTYQTEAQSYKIQVSMPSPTALSNFEIN